MLGYAITADAMDPSVVNVFECYENEEAPAAVVALRPLRFPLELDEGIGMITTNGSAENPTAHEDD